MGSPGQQLVKHAWLFVTLSPRPFKAIPAILVRGVFNLYLLCIYCIIVFYCIYFVIFYFVIVVKWYIHTNISYIGAPCDVAMKHFVYHFKNFIFLHILWLMTQFTHLLPSTLDLKDISLLTWKSSESILLCVFLCENYRTKLIKFLRQMFRSILLLGITISWMLNVWASYLGFRTT